jgi:hypothetical protein
MLNFIQMFNNYRLPVFLKYYVSGCCFFVVRLGRFSIEFKRNPVYCNKLSAKDKHKLILYSEEKTIEELRDENQMLLFENISLKNYQDYINSQGWQIWILLGFLFCVFFLFFITKI